MFTGIESVLIFSEDQEKLAKFYENKVGLKLTGEYEMGEAGDSVSMFEFENGTTLSILKHSQVHGKSKEPQRIQLNIGVKDIEAAVKKVKGQGVKVVQDTYHIEGYGYLATFEDLDGNYFQLVQVRSS
jgi:predicted enzyme related to lactoylglutathione lyase